MTAPKTPFVCCSVASPAAGQGAATMQRPWKLSDARLVLEDGSVWNAKSFGASGTQVGEVVFNTSMTG
jgi:carbamoyl-phosphate synthase small subunit